MEGNYKNKTEEDFLTYTGDGKEIFKFAIVNAILTFITFGFYYPWAKVAMLKYNYNNVYFKDSPFEFHGTGKELFIGMLKFILALIVFYIMMFLFMIMGAGIVAMISNLSGPLAVLISVAISFLFFIFIIGLIAYAIYGALRYRASRSSWRGIFFQYSDNLSQFTKFYGVQMILTAVTVGLYGSWASCKMLKRYASNLTFGNVKFKFWGKGEDLFVINIIGFILSIITLGIYIPFFIAKRTNFIFNNTSMHQNEKESIIKSNIDGMDILINGLVYGLLTIITFGLAYPWFQAKLAKVFVNSISVEGDVDFDNLKQGEVSSPNAFGESLFDGMDTPMF